MVLLHVKQGQDLQFLFDCLGTRYVDDVIRDTVSISNLQKKIENLGEQGNQLALYGPAKDPDRNEDEDSDDDVESPQCSSSVKPRGPFYNRDPSNKRTGEACDPDIAEKLTQSLEDMTNRVSKEGIDLVRGAVMICYPQGLPHYDPVHKHLFGVWEAIRGKLSKEELINGQYYYFSPPWPAEDALDPDTTTMWWAGKELMRENRLCDHVGKNEKTKIVVKLQGKGKAAPPREPPIDPETQKAMMAWYYKKQEEHKRLSADEDDSYTNAEWANPRALKSALQHIPNVALK